MHFITKIVHNKSLQQIVNIIFHHIQTLSTFLACPPAGPCWTSQEASWLRQIFLPQQLNGYHCLLFNLLGCCVKPQLLTTCECIVLDVMKYNAYNFFASLLEVFCSTGVHP